MGTKTNNSLSVYDEEKEAKKVEKNKYYDGQVTLLQQQYGNSQAELDASKKRQQEMASISLDKLEKYLPYQIKAQGLSGSGASESTMLKARNNYVNTMADIASNYNSEKRALDTSRSSELSSLERYRAEALDAIDEKYDAQRDTASSENLILYNDKVVDMLGKYADEDGKLTTDERKEIEKYIESKADQLTEADMLRLRSALDGYVTYNQDEQAEIDKAQAASENKANQVKLESWDTSVNGERGDNFRVSIGDEIYKIEKGNDVIDKEVEKEITSAYGGNPNIGSSVVYNGKIYMYLPNKATGKNRWCSIQSRHFNTTDFRKLCEALGITAYKRELKTIYEYA